jgi:hypothetical protein
MSDPRGLPKWAAALDYLAIALAIVALSVFIGGGFRSTIFGVRLSVTDWWRPAAASVVLLGVRHWRVRHAPFPQRVWRAMRRWWSAPDTKVVLPIHLGTRGGVIAVGFLAVTLIGFPPAAASRWRIYDNDFLDLPARWDAGWYLGIVIDGYTWSANQPESQQNIAFFPAMPLAVRYLSELLGHQPLWTAVGLSLVCFYGALVYLLRLARDHLGDEGAAATAVALLASYPFALFFSAPYTESLFLLTLVGAVYHFRRGELWPAMLWGFVAGLTRPNGCFLSIVLGLMAIEPLWKARSDPRGPDGTSGAGRVAQHLDRLAAAAAPGLGMLAYSTYVYFLTGNPFQWAAQNAAWGRVYRGLDTVIADRVEYVSRFGIYGYAADQPLDMLYALAVLFVLGAAWPVYRRFGLPYAAMLVVNTLPPVAMGGLLSMGRVTSVLFPAFLWMAAAVPAHHRPAWIAVFAVLQGFAAVMFFTWRPLF